VRVVLADTGPLVALFDARERNHAWAVDTLAHLQEPLLTCDSVISETTYHLGAGSDGCLALIEMVERGLVKSAFELQPQIRRIRALMQRYASVPMSFADACLVRLSELHGDVIVWTLDSDFQVYRRHGRQAIPTLMPND
jgi:uncharacterized protein